MYSIPACARIRAEPNEKHAGDTVFAQCAFCRKNCEKYGIKAVTARSTCIIAPIFLFCKYGYSI